MEPTAVHYLGDVCGGQGDDCLAETQHDGEDLMVGIEGDSDANRVEEDSRDGIGGDKTVAMLGMWQVA